MKKKEQLTLFQGFLRPSVTAQVKKKKKKREERKDDNGSFLQETLDYECAPPASPSKTSLPSPAEDEKPLGFQIC